MELARGIPVVRGVSVLGDLWAAVSAFAIVGPIERRSYSPMYRDQVRRLISIILSAPRSATARFVGGIFILLGAGVALHLLLIPQMKGGTALESLVRGLADAALVSGVLAIVVDPYLKQRLQDESAWGAIFGYLNPHAPEKLRQAIKELAALQTYFTKVVWTIDFSWHDTDRTVLAIKLTSTNTGKNATTRPYKPNSDLWVLASTAGKKSEYLNYSLSCSNGKFQTINHASKDLISFVTTRHDQSITLNERDAIKGKEIPAGEKFERTIQTIMFRHIYGYYPLHHDRFVESFVFNLSGTALDDLDVRISHPQGDISKKLKPADWKRIAPGKRNPDRTAFGRVTPGQVTLVSWSPAAHRISPSIA